MIRVRIAPSPTGQLHVGTAHTALFNYLFARHHGGSFILRIEDTDLERSDKKYEKDIFEGLKWLGIEADESPEKGGLFAPYRQSERLGNYKKYAEKLLEGGSAFYCFHSLGELEEEKKNLMEAKRAPVHFCEYRTMDPGEAKMLAETKPDHIIRFKTPAGRKISFNDLIRGEVSFDSDLLGDFSIAKRTDVPLYNFAVVVDDEEMNISHVIRGEDHIPNTPKQILLIEALGFKIPQYAHLPLILGTDRSKLSKRHGATSVNEYKNAGYLPDAMFNFLALLGWAPGNDKEIFTHNELVREFSLGNIQRSGAIFDAQKLDWMNGEYIRKKAPDELLDLCMPFFQFSISNSQFSNDYFKKVITLEQPRLKRLAEIGERTDYFFREPEYAKELLRWKKMTDEEIVASLDKSIQILHKNESAGMKELETVFLNEASAGGDKGKLLWPLRVALSGKKSSPGPFEILEILGIEKAVQRLRTAKKLVK